MTIYTDNGYKNRKAYLDSLADEHGVPARIVYTLAELLGPNEDFDGLVVSVEDASMELSLERDDEQA